MGGDYVYPSIYFSYFFFTIMAVLALYFMVRSWRDGYFGPKGEEIKHRMMDEDDFGQAKPPAPPMPPMQPVPTILPNGS